MPDDTIDHVEQTLLKALQHNDRASLSEVAAMLPSETGDRLQGARAKLEQQRLIEAVPGSTTGQMQLTSKGAELANDFDDGQTRGSGGGDSKFE